jgi:hypothetical protein
MLKGSLAHAADHRRPEMLRGASMIASLKLQRSDVDRYGRQVWADTNLCQRVSLCRPIERQQWTCHGLMPLL